VVKDVMQAPKGPRRPTIRAVADRAGVSQTTVSFVINDKPGAAISEATRQRVWQAVEELGYRPNHAARSLSTRRSGLIGFLSDGMAGGGEYMLGAQSVTWAQGRMLLVVETEADETRERGAIEELLSRQVEGMLIGSAILRPWRPPAVLDETPTALVNCYDPDGRFPAVIPDEFAGGHAAVSHLIAAGHRRIGLICGPMDRESRIRRCEGCLAAMREAGLPTSPEMQVLVSCTPQGGRVGASRLLDLPKPPTALLCASDWVALGAYQELARRGLSVPDDIAVVGYGDQEFAARLDPPLTTLALPHRAIGQQAAALLMARRDRPLAPEVIRVTCPLVVRGSV
jgi:LacI family transcriptional regulator